MKILALVTIFVIISCSGKREDAVIFESAVADTTAAETVDTSPTASKVADYFPQLTNFPKIEDSATFIAGLKKNIEIYDGFKNLEQITAYQKIRLYGSDKEYILVEYSYDGGAMASYPWKHQLIFTTDGKRIAALNALRYELVKILRDEKPFLLTANSTGKGNGWHELYKISGDTIENVYDGVSDWFPRTYDIHEDETINEPGEFRLLVKDYNNDGFNDIAFKGKFVYIEGQTPMGDWYNSDTKGVYSKENPFKKLPVELIFLYNPKTGHFVQKEDYSKRYLKEVFMAP